MSFTRGYFAGTVTALFAVGVYQYVNVSPRLVEHGHKSQIADDFKGLRLKEDLF
jgi:hypothetical protein